jgi:4'-phosphopantetheinyl transferase
MTETVSPTFGVAAERPTLGRGEAHVWTLADATSCDPARRLAVLDPVERARAARFKLEHHRLEYIAAHWLLRVALSHYDDRPPQAWQFAAEAGGRPIVLGNTSAPDPLRFSLSHAAGRALVAVSRAPAIGVDLEGEASLARMTELASRILTPRELALWQQQPGPQAARFALARWTLKEAYAKARGLGLKLDFSHFGFSDTDGELRLDEAPLSDPAPQDWRFFSFVPWPTGCAALAVLADRGETITFRFLLAPPVGAGLTAFNIVTSSGPEPQL